MKDKAVTLLKRLTQAHGASGSEDAVRRIFIDELGKNVTCDRSGSVIFEKTGTTKKPRVMLAAHLDEVGFMVQSIVSDGTIRFVPLGGWWGHVLLAQRVRIRTRTGDEVLGVIGAKPPHLLEESERKKVLKLESMLIDIGACDADEVRDRFGIRLGDSIVPDSPFTRLANPDFLLSKAFDDRVGVALAIQSVQQLKGKSHPNTVVSVGTVQEEVGTRGAATAAAVVNPDVCIVLEGPPADDLPKGVSDAEMQGKLGGGVQIRLMDPSAISNRHLADWVIDLAAANDVPAQLAVRRSGGTDARPIHLHDRGVPTLVLGVPARYIHTHNSIIHLDDYLAALKLTGLILTSLDAKAAKLFTDFL